MLDRVVATLVTLGAAAVAIWRYRTLNTTYDRIRPAAKSDGSFRYVYGPLVLVTCIASVAAYWNLGNLVLHRSGILRLIGSALIIVGVFGFEWSVRALGPQYSPSYDLRVPTVRVTTGPYRWLSHPLYLSNITTLLGASIGSGSIVAALSLFIVSAYYVRAAGEEDRLLRGIAVTPDLSGGPCS